MSKMTEQAIDGLKADMAELARLRAREKVLVDALIEAVYEVTHLSAPRPNDTAPIYRPVIKGKTVDGWRKALATLDVPDPKEQT